MSIFETASRKKFRFPSVKGDLTAEQLWDLPLIVRSPTRDVKADLDTVARAINTELKGVAEETFVNVRPDPRAADLATKLEIVKHVIAVKQKEAADAHKATERAAERRRIVEAIALKDGQELANASKEDLLKRLEALDAVA